MLRTLIASTLLLAGLAQAGLSDMRATSEQDRLSFPAVQAAEGRKSRVLTPALLLEQFLDLYINAKTRPFSSSILMIPAARPFSSSMRRMLLR